MQGAIAGHKRRKAAKEGKTAASERDRLRKEFYKELMAREGYPE